MRKIVILLLALCVFTSAQAYRQIWYAFIPNNIPDFQLDCINPVKIETNDPDAKNNITCTWISGGLQCMPTVYQVNNHKTIKVDISIYFNGALFVARDLNFDYWPYPKNNDVCTYMVVINRDVNTGQYFLGQGALNCN